MGQPFGMVSGWQGARCSLAKGGLTIDAAHNLKLCRDSVCGTYLWSGFHFHLIFKVTTIFNHLSVVVFVINAVSHFVCSV